MSSLNISNSRFWKLVMFWMLRYHGRALWLHGGNMLPIIRHFSNVVNLDISTCVSRSISHAVWLNKSGRCVALFWTVSHNYAIFFILLCQIYPFQLIFTCGLSSLNISNSRFRKLIMFWMWRYHGRAFRRRGGNLLPIIQHFSNVVNLDISTCVSRSISHAVWLNKSGRCAALCWRGVGGGLGAVALAIWFGR